MEPLTVKAEDAAQLIGVSIATIYKLTHREDFPAVRVGRKILISRTGLERWLDEHAGEVVAL